ncbi:hypothetical protein GCM10009696_24420 [Kocuria himachalensis]
MKRSPVQTVLALLTTGFGIVPPEVHGRRTLRLPAPDGAAVTLTDPVPRATGRGRVSAVGACRPDLTGTC